MASQSSLTLDPTQARQIGALLVKAYREDGILGSGKPPERRVPQGMDRGDRAHLHFITLTAAIDYHRDRWELWSAARETVADGDTAFVFDPAAVVDGGEEQLRAALQVHGLSGKPNKDADIWFRICTTLVEHYAGSAWRLLEENDFAMPAILAAVRSTTRDFPYLGGRKLGSLWSHYLADAWGGHALTGLREIPIYVDRDVAAASVAAGAVVGPFDGPYDDLKAAVVDVWAAACVDELEDYTTKGIRYPMQVYAPLSELGARGCRNVESWPCPVRRDCPVMIFCVETRPRKGGDGLVFGGPKQVGTAISL